MSDTIFFRLLADDDKDTTLSDAVEVLSKDEGTFNVYPVDPTSLREVPSSSFVYWVSEDIRHKYTQLPPFEDEKRMVKQGLVTADDFRFVRSWLEVPAKRIAISREDTRYGKRWVTYAKGGQYSPFYANFYLVVNWEADGEEIKSFFGPGGKVASRPQNLDYYFRAGLTFPGRPHKKGSFWVLPKGCIFSHTGMGIFAPSEQLAPLASTLNSSAYLNLLGLLMPRGTLGGQTMKYEVGYVTSVPLPPIETQDNDIVRLSVLARSNIVIYRDLDSAHEISHAFRLPSLLQVAGESLDERITSWKNQVSRKEQQLTEHQREIDDVAFQLYGIGEADRRAIEESLGGGDGAVIPAEDDSAAEAEEAEEIMAVLDGATLAADLLASAVGCIFGRWDARIALDSSLAPKLQDPFAPLPVCSPGMLVGPDGLPAQRDGIASEEWMQARPDAITPPPEGSVENSTIPDSKYPLAVDWDGILVDDPDHPDDILRRVRDVLELVWGGNADEIEHEACGLLGVKDLRAYFRNPRKFWDFHVKRYSKSRRKAPIYWLLQSPKRNFGLWIYYHRLDPDILFKALTKYVEPKIRLEEGRLEEFEARRRDAGTGGREAKQAEKAVGDQEALLTDLREFRDRLQRAASLYLRPDLNDGVVLNIAPLHELVPWKEANSKWDDLLAGKYEWSSIGKQLREKGLV